MDRRYEESGSNGRLCSAGRRVLAILICGQALNTTPHSKQELLRKLPKALRKFFTVDNGSEFYDLPLLTKLTGMNVYFCDLSSPWQRGSNENPNGLLRQFFPKGASLADVTDQQLQFAVDLINHRPRKRFGYRSPAELLADLLCCT